MSDRVRGFIVTLGEDIREDDMDNIVNAIAMIKGVISVEPKVSGIEDHMSDMRAKDKFRRKLVDFFEKELC